MALLPEKYGCLYIDCTWRDILAAYSYTLSNLDKKKVQGKVEGLFGGSEQWLACISVRSAFDLFLTVMNFPRDSEIIYTAVNIPDMTEIAEYHGLKVVPVDIDIETLAPKEELLELAVTDNTVAILAAHIYGKWIDLRSIKKIARTYGLYLLEDCAECFHGLKMTGDKNSDLVFFSFGSIKYNTALGGAVVKVKDDKILARMRAKLESYPHQSHWTYFLKLIKYSVLMMGMNSPTISWVGIYLFHLFKFHYKELFISFLRGFPGNLVASLHYQPSAALLAFMFRRITNARKEDFELCKKKGDYVKKRLPDGVVIPGSSAKVGNYWLFPIVVDDPAEVCKELEKEGIEAYIGATQLRSVKRTQGRTHTICNGSYTGCSTQQDKTQSGELASLPSASTDDQLDLSMGLLSDVEVGAASADEQCLGNIPLVQTGPSHSILTKSNCSKTPSGELPRNELYRRGIKSGSNSRSDTNRASINGINRDVLFPHNATYLIDHVVYLPVHKRVPIWYLDFICSAVEKVMQKRIANKLKSKRRTSLHSKL